MAYINQIKVLGTTYDIGMKNAVHFHGTTPVSTFKSDAACTTAATAADLGNDLYFKGLTIGTYTVEIGCMWIPTSAAGAESCYEYVCTEILSGEGTANQIAKFECLGHVKESTGTGVLSVGTAAQTVVTSAGTHGSIPVVTSVTRAGAGTALKSDQTLATANYSVITATPGTASTFQFTYENFDVVSSVSTSPVTVVTSVSGGTASGNTGSFSHTLNKGVQDADVSGGGVTLGFADKDATLANGSVSGTVSGGGASGATGTVTATVSGGSVSVDVDEADADLEYGAHSVTFSGGSATGNTGTLSGSVNVPTGATLNNGDKTVSISGIVTNVTHTGVGVRTSSAQVNTSYLPVGTVTNSVLDLGYIAVDSGTVTVSKGTLSGTVSVPTSVTLNDGSKSVSISGIVTSVSHTNPSGSVSVVTKVTYKRPTGATLTAPSVTVPGVVTSVSHTNPTVTVSVPTKVTLNVATGASHTNPTVKLSVVTSISNHSGIVTSVSNTAASAGKGVVTGVTGVGTTAYTMLDDINPMTVVTSVPNASKTVVTGWGTASTINVCSNITVDTANVINSVALTTGSINKVTSVTTGTIVTAVNA